MSEAAPMEFTWNAERSVMVPRRARAADRVFVDGETYRLGIIEERSAASHSHYFASLAEAYANLPDREVERFPTVEHLRKYALIKCGFYDSTAHPCKSHAEALRLASFIRPMDEFAVVTAKDSVVTRYVAKSQSNRSMSKEEFQKSKTAVLDYVASLIGVTTKDLEQGQRMTTQMHAGSYR